MNGGYGMRYDVLREYAVRDGAELLRLNAYLSFDRQRAEEDEVYRRGQANYTDNLRDFGYKVSQKKVRRYDNGDAPPLTKADLDVEIAVDMLTQGQNLDRIILATGNGDFVQAVRALQEKGKRVEILGFDKRFRATCDGEAAPVHPRLFDPQPASFPRPRKGHRRRALGRNRIPRTRGLLLTHGPRVWLPCAT